ncbi:mediator of RNA polymerase II transcription subunit 10 [Myriangium duriaei CBS 260.36]|uniref:Mediator of RNA polymerase II transcription subunit 10 n=1 Tax=Myriangium duriaei CBS 260.36 TaxID=1168546 RepID=A0A9P4J8W2_9PEZI|nr:mediator of RNA polymerase II transcription subunit 10 [Myriangium duriaei CBS 260.36]
MAEATLDEVEVQLRTIIQQLHFLLVETYDYHGPNTTQAMSGTIKDLLRTLATLLGSAKRLPVGVPAEVISDFVEKSRNPDIYTREFVEHVQKLNQQLSGRSQAYADFRDALARELVGAVPELRTEVARVVESSGGKLGAA